MDLADFDYELPADRIAQVPLPERDASRLMVIHRSTGRIEHRRFRDLGDYVGPGDALIRNNAAVLPSRLAARRVTGGNVECFLSAPTELPLEWICLLRPGRKLADGSSFGVPGEFTARVIETRGDGTYRVRFDIAGTGTVIDLARRIGQVPLPPYIARDAQDARSATDRERYQTVYASERKPVAAAAPTAGLHFTPRLLRQLEESGVRFAEATLHVGLGTFKPIQTERIEDHQIHREFYELPPETCRMLSRPDGLRRIAIGTTVVRSIEDFLAHPRMEAASIEGWRAEAGIYIHPPFAFRGVDALITNFHQPRSTLLCLVSAFLRPGCTDGVPMLRELYAEALRKDYRFLSYGDAMLIL